MPRSTLAADIDRQGFAVVSNFVCEERLHRCSHAIEASRSGTSPSQLKRSASTSYAIRNLVDEVPETRCVLQERRLIDTVTKICGSNSFLVRATLFDKTPDANWGVFRHQDRAIACRERYVLPGYEKWTRKAGIPCVQPPAEIMQSLLAIRIHLDACTAENGPLRVLPGTHNQQILTDDGITRLSRSQDAVDCLTPAGGAVLMRPLLLHSSAPMREQVTDLSNPQRRRVMHLEFTAQRLPDPLEWGLQIPLPTAED